VVLLQRWQHLMSTAEPGVSAPPDAWGVRALLTDFGSARPARAAAAAAATGGATARAAARAAVEAAAAECTAPYRAPELFDCADVALLDERVDVWALGCTLCAPRRMQCAHTSHA
jgi:serine/threonine kinase 16